MFSTAIVSLALAASALANVFITSPVATSSFPAGQQSTISWMDDGMSPSLLQFGNATFAIYAGNAIQQTLLQSIATVNVSTTSSITFTPDPTIGPSGNEYFIRVTSLSLMNPSSPQFPMEAFSAKFSLTGMSGQFNASVQAEINGQSTAPIGGSTAAPSMSMTMMPSSAKTTPTITTVASAKPTTTATNGAGKSVVTTGIVGLVAVAVGAALL